MGTINSCRCTKGGDVHDLDLVKEQSAQTAPRVKLSSSKNAEKIVKETVLTKTENSVGLSKKNLNKKLDEIILGENSEKIIKHENDNIIEIVSSPNIVINASHARNFSQDMNLELLEDNLFSHEELQVISNGTCLRKSKKNVTLGSSATVGSKTPLEVINEINVDVSKESHEQKAQINENYEVMRKDSRFSQNGNGNELLKENFSKSELKNLKSSGMSFELTQKLQNNEIMEANNVPNKEKNLQENINNYIQSHSNPQNRLKNVNNVQSWQSITSIIPESRLLNCTEGN